MTRLIENQQHTAQWVREKKGSLDIAVAFWGAGAIEELGLDRKGRSFRVLLDLSAGASNPSVVKALMKLAPDRVKCVERLHAKAYLSNSEVLIGSANASANGLGSEGSEATCWIELGILTNAPEVVRDAKVWFKSQWNMAETITPAMLKEAERTWSLRQRIRPSRSSDAKYLLEAAVANPSEFRDRRYFVVVNTEDMSEEGERQKEKIKERTGKTPYAWEGWSNIPRDAHLISFDFEDNKFYIDGLGIYYSPSERMQEGVLTLVNKSTIPGFKLDKINQWRSALERAKKSVGPKKWKKDSGLCMDLGEFAKRFGRD